MSKILRFILPFLLFTLLSNPTCAIASYEGKESREIAFSARKLGFNKISQLGEFAKSSTGQIWPKIKASSNAVTEYGYKIFKKG